MNIKKTYYFQDLTSPSRDTNLRYEEIDVLVKDDNTLCDRDSFYETIDTKIKHKDLTLEEGDRLYFLSGCIVPRYKVRDYGGDKNVKITIKPELATKTFINPESKKDFKQGWSSSGYAISCEDFVDFCEANYGTDDLIVIPIDEIKKSSLPVLINRNVKNLMINRSHRLQSFNNFKTSFNGDPEHGYYEINSGVKMKSLINCVDQGNLYDEKLLLPIISGESNPLTKSSFEAIKSMLNSSDKGDSELAVELMSSCNYTESISYLFLLFNTSFSDICGAKGYNHSAFRNLRKFMGNTALEWGVLDHCIDKLKKEEQLTKENLIKLTDFYLSDDGASHLYQVINSQYLKAEQIGFTDNLVSLLPKESVDENELVEL